MGASTQSAEGVPGALPIGAGVFTVGGAVRGQLVATHHARVMVSSRQCAAVTHEQARFGDDGVATPFYAATQTEGEGPVDSDMSDSHE